MRIAIITDAWEPQINGVVRTYQNLTRELVRMGHEVRVIGPGNFINIPMPSYPEIRLSLFPARKLARLLHDFKPDCVHIAVEGPLGLTAQRWCRKNGMAYTTSFHTQFPDYVAERLTWAGKASMRLGHTLARRFVTRFHAGSKAIFVATQTLEDQLIAWGFKSPMVRLLRGVDYDVFHPGPSPLFADVPKPVQLYVGRVAVEKNIGAFLDLKQGGTKIVVGHGPAAETLKKRYPNVIFAGLQQGKALADHYRAADVFVFPSKTDTFGIVLIEALACGVPIAGYDVMGPRDIVDRPMFGSVNGALDQALTSALQAPGTEDERSAAARTLYSWEAVAKIFAETL